MLQSDVPIRVHANWRPLDPGVLGSAGPATYSRNFAGAPLTNTWYPIALANRIAGSDLAPNSVDINCNFSSVFNNWYFGTDGNPPVNQYDLMSVVLHELGHGLGFTGTMTVNNNGVGSWGGGTAFPVAYDRFGVNGSGQQLVSTSLFPNPSIALGQQLTSGTLFFNGTAARIANGGASPRIYAPSPFDPGSSFAHLDEATFPKGNPNSLMTPQIGTNEAIHSPGAIGMGVLQDLGWTFTTAMMADDSDGEKVGCCGTGKSAMMQDLKMPDAEQARLVDAAVELTKASVDQDDPKFYEQLSQSLMQLKQARSESIPVEPVNDAEESRRVFQPMRLRTTTPETERISVADDPVWRDNFIKWLSLPRRDRLRIWGGAPVLAGEFEHCVAVGGGGRFCCTGTLVAPRVVITAAHCFHLGCIGSRGEVYFGLNSNNPGTGRVVACKCVPHPDYKLSTDEHDIAVLILDQPVTDVAPCPIATPSQIDDAFFLRLAGFGLTETGRSGRKMQVEVVVASNNCSSSSHQSTFGCKRDREIVAGGNGLDSCNGDSGGPAYVDVGGRFLLAGATSRAAANSQRGCGDGGIYVRIDKELEWIESVVAAEGLSIACDSEDESEEQSNSGSVKKE
ncbi:MAG: trypsin-like serine protease [Planctomycetales bacterium]|nr:trypsin-like serine protease [Planctomycetales bacterium]